ncbi:MAG: T9SS type A sorting domain-containing protein [Daejeonella sp.]
MMKNYFSVALLSLFVLAGASSGSTANAQDIKGTKRSIIINNGDTVVNGKKFSELTKDEQTKLRKEFKEMESTFKASTRFGKDNEVIRRRDGHDADVIIGKNGKEPSVLFWNDEAGDDLTFNLEHNKLGNFQGFKFNGDSSTSFGFNADTLIKGFNFKIDSNLRKRIITMHRDRVPGFPGTFDRMEMPGQNFERRGITGLEERNNSSSFNYSHTDKDGVSSRMSIRLSDAGKDQLKKITGAETVNKSLDAADLTLFPNFSSGKMTLSFNLSSKGTAKVAILDSDLKPLFSDETANFSGNYVKQVSLPKNGIYYITVSQNGNWFVKKLIKE